MRHASRSGSSTPRPDHQTTGRGTSRRARHVHDRVVGSRRSASIDTSGLPSWDNIDSTQFGMSSSASRLIFTAGSRWLTSASQH